MSAADALKDWETSNTPAAPDPAAPPPLSGSQQVLADMDKSPEELAKQAGPPPSDVSFYSPASWADRGRMAMTMGVRAGGGLVDAAHDPLGTVYAPFRRLFDPEEEKRYQQAEGPGPGRKLGDAIFRWTGVDEFKPRTPGERAGLAAGTGMLAGAPFGLLGAALGLTAGGLGQGVEDATGSERWGTAASLVPGLLVAGGGIPTAAARSQAATRLTPELAELGTKPTLGQALGGMWNTAEQRLTSAPFMGERIASGRRSTHEELVRALTEKPLEKIGEQLNPETPTGRASTDEMMTKVGEAYDRLTPNLGVQPDAQFAVTDLPAIQQRFMYPPQKQAFDDLLERYVKAPFRAGGAISGEMFRNAERDIGRLASQHSNSPVAAEQLLGGALGETQGALRALQMRSNPQHAEELRTLNDAYADSIRLQQAGGYIGAREGIPSPEHLLRATRELDPSLRHSAFARGNARLQQIAEEAKTLLGATVPDSGTAGRSLQAHPLSWLPGLLASVPAGALYSRGGRAMTTNFLGPRTAPPGWMTGLLAAQDQTQQEPVPMGYYFTDR